MTIDEAREILNILKEYERAYQYSKEEVVGALDMAIQALERQRNITNEELYQGFIELEAENERLHDVLEQQRWIPVSERLPEESGAYLVWMIWGDEEPTYSIINFDADYNEFGEWIEHYDINTLGVLDREFRTYIDVFAWCPLPQPYKEEQDGKNNTDND